jgi:hypothetical protein
MGGGAAVVATGAGWVGTLVAAATSVGADVGASVSVVHALSMIPPVVTTLPLKKSRRVNFLSFLLADMCSPPVK